MFDELWMRERKNREDTFVLIGECIAFVYMGLLCKKETEREW